MPVNEKLSVFESDNAGYDVSTKQTGWTPSAVHLDKRATLPTAAVVNPRDQFLVPLAQQLQAPRTVCTASRVNCCRRLETSIKLFLRGSGLKSDLSYAS